MNWILHDYLFHSMCSI